MERGQVGMVQIHKKKFIIQSQLQTVQQRTRQPANLPANQAISQRSFRQLRPERQPLSRKKKSSPNCFQLRLTLIAFQFTNRFLAPAINQLAAARRVQDVYPFIKGLKAWRRHVEITHRESPLLVLTMQHKSKVV